MRIFTTFPEAFDEIKRDLGEMGIKIETKTMQDKNIEGDEDFTTMELQNYIYTVTHPVIKELEPVQPWANAEWQERMRGIFRQPVNPGKAYKLRAELWNEFLHDDKFAYTYSDRWSTYGQVMNVINRLQSDKFSRQLYISMFESRDTLHLGTMRVPCSLGWHLMYRDGALNMTYFMRSCDWSVHFQNDVFLSMKLLELIANSAELTVGKFTHFMSSLHIYTKDLGVVF